jgi:adenylate cyclase
MSETRKLAAILVADVVGYSRLAGVDEERTLARLRGLRSDLLDPIISVHTDGSSSALAAARSSSSAGRRRRALSHRGAERPHRTQRGLSQERRIEFRAGIRLGNVVDKVDGDLMGDVVSINVG